MKTFLLAAAILMAVPALGQEVKHAPTAAQCQADQAVWLSKLQEPADGWANTVKDTSSTTVLAWGEEMNTCIVVDPSNNYKYGRTIELALLVIGQRKADFLGRHHLLDQFIAEDEAGAR